MPRIVSLIASATEIVCALGCERDLVGISHECDFPKSVTRLPRCTRPRFDIHGSSLEIDQRVREVLRQSLSVYEVDTELLRTLRPDVIVTQIRCEVCAVSRKDVEQALVGWLESRPTVVSLAPNALADVWQDIQQVADALHAPERGQALVRQLQQSMAEIADLARLQPYRPTLACVEWIEPLMMAGNWMPELVEMAGGVPLFGAAGQHSPRLTWDELRSADPDVIAVMPCGWDIAKARQEMAVLTGQPGWAQLRAVRGGHVFLTDGNQFFNRPGPRLLESLEILAELLHPETFALGHRGTGWVPL